MAICGRDKARLEAAAAEIGGDCVPLVADVCDAAGGAAFVAAATEALGGVDILVTNAGGPPAGNFAATDVDAYPDALGLNLLSVVGMCKAAAPAMQERGWGRVVAITSIAVRQPIANLILSNTARAGATGFLKTMARELAGSGVTVNSVQPGLHRTPRIVAALRRPRRPVRSANRTTSAASSPSCAASRPSSSPGRRSTSTAAPTPPCCDARWVHDDRQSPIGQRRIGGTYSPIGDRSHQAFVRRRSARVVKRYSKIRART